MKSNSKRKVNGPGWRAVLSYLEQGKVVVGIDEVGRGALAGPVTAAAVILPERLYLRGLNDSKLLDPLARRRLDRQIRTHAIAVGLGWASHEEINERGLSWAVRQSGLRALADLSADFDVVILDGNHNYLKDSHDSVAIVKADQKVASV